MKSKINLMGMLCLINKLLKIKHILVLLLVFMCVWSRNSVAQTKTPIPIDELGELKVGDTVPEELWNHPMELWTAADGSTKTITLNDYRGKVIILDFWATWCGSCINYFPHMQDIQNQAGEGLIVFPVTYEPSVKVQTFSDGSTSRIFTRLKDNFHSIVGQELGNIFRARSLPHIIVINKTGTIQASTAPQYINHEVVAQLLKGEEDVYIPLKRNGFPQPRLALNEYYDDVKVHSPLYYRGLIGFTDGITHDAPVWKTDTLNSRILLNVPNTFVMMMYRITKQFGVLAAKHNRIILNVKNPKQYVYRPENYTDIEWRRDNFYTYEASFPLDWNREKAGEMMRGDLDLFLGVESKIEKRKVECLVLKKLEGYILPDSLINARKSKNMGYSINYNNLELPFIIDELEEEGWIWPLNIAAHEWKDLSIVRPKLWAYGLDLVPESREIDMFVLTEKGRKSIPMDQLELTRSGYVPKS